MPLETAIRALIREELRAYLDERARRSSFDAAPGGVTILHGDCLDQLKTLAPNSIQTCVTSPPYWLVRDYGHRQWMNGNPECDHDKSIAHRVKVPTFDPGTWDRTELKKLHGRWARNHHGYALTHACSKCGAWFGQLGLEPTIDKFVANTVSVFREVRRVLRKDGTLWLNIGDTTRNKRLMGIPWRLALALQEDGWHIRSEIIWHKPNSAPEGVFDRPHKAHETVFLLSKQKRYYFDLHAVREPTHHRRSVWRIPIRRNVSAHTTVFADELAKICITASTRPGDTVLDPFAGSGTTCSTAVLLDRKFVGIELDGRYLPLIRQRVEAAEQERSQREQAATLAVE